MSSTTKLLSEVAIMASGGTPNRKNLDYWNGDIPWVTTAEVSQYQYILDTKEKITELGLQNSSAKLFPEGSILLALYGQGKTRGKVALLGIPATTNQACLAIQPDNTLLKTKYLYYYLENSYEKLRKMANSGGQDNLSMAILKEFPISFPDLSTQEYRVNLFDKLSLKIQLQQEKIDLLREQKKGIMQKIFTQKLRFKDENGQEFPQWKKGTMSSLIKVNSGRDYKHLGKGNIPVYGTGGHMLNVDQSLSDVDAIGIGRKGTIDVPQILVGPFWTVDTLFYCTPIGQNDLQFIYTLFEMINWKAYDESTGVPSLSKKTIENITIDIPDIQEQKKIGSFFKKINTKIDFHVQKLQVLNLQKQAFMQQMFI